MKKITVIGSGGLGANLAILLTEQGHQVTIIDADRTDDKFFHRFGFFTGSRILFNGVPKVRAVAACAFARGRTIVPIETMADDEFDFTTIAGTYCVIAVDTAMAREIIEAKLVAAGCKEFVHIGCNLDSISIFPTMKDIISTDPAPDASTSYDVVPDLKTYLLAAAQLVSLIDNQPIRTWIDDDIVRATEETA